MAAKPPQPFLIDGERRQIRYYGRVLELSRYEYGLLCLLVQRPGRVYTRDELLEMVWDDPATASTARSTPTSRRCAPS